MELPKDVITVPIGVFSPKTKLFYILGLKGIDTLTWNPLTVQELADCMSVYHKAKVEDDNEIKRIYSN